jgi:hypothetical protein
MRPWSQTPMPPKKKKMKNVLGPEDDVVCK